MKSKQPFSHLENGKKQIKLTNIHTVIHPSIHQFIHESVHPSKHISHPSTHLSSLFIHPPIHLPPVYTPFPSIHLSSIHPSTHSFIHQATNPLSTCLYTFPIHPVIIHSFILSSTHFSQPPTHSSIHPFTHLFIFLCCCQPCS